MIASCSCDRQFVWLRKNYTREELNDQQYFEKGKGKAIRQPLFAEILTFLYYLSNQNVNILQRVETHIPFIYSVIKQGIPS